MRKALSMLLYVCIALPVSIGALFLVSTSGSILDRGFYKRLVSDERIMVVAADPAFVRRAPERVTLGSVILDGRAAWAAALKTVPADAIRNQATTAIDAIFDSFEGSSRDASIETAHLKKALKASLPAFSSAYALSIAVADRAPAFDAVPVDLGTRPKTVSADKLASVIASRGIAAVDGIPDRVPLESMGMGRIEGTVGKAVSIRAVLVKSTGTAVIAATLLVAACAFIGSAGLGGRLTCFGSMAIIPGGLVLVLGAVSFLFRPSALGIGSIRELGLAPGTIAALSGFLRDTLGAAARGFLVSGGIVVAIGVVATGVGRGLFTTDAAR
ncbi:MAG: hypothetical protein NT080_05075 [Spirochaetes bacterium]|nr:hypothetical protein [Spirochaetota bacterium]